jgi:hypothetical protein
MARKIVKECKDRAKEFPLLLLARRAQHKIFVIGGACPLETDRSNEKIGVWTSKIASN